MAEKWPFSFDTFPWAIKEKYSYNAYLHIMLRIFSRIRHTLIGSSAGRYFLYAFGEIALVVIGILLALQINNWNDLRKAKQQEQKLFVKIIKDLQSDSILFAENLERYKNQQNLHYQLYEEMKGRASFDSSYQYGRIRYVYPFNPLVKENYQSLVENIINEKVRDELSDYFRREENISEGMSQFHDLVIGVVRPYLTSKNIMDVDAVYGMSRYASNDPNLVLNYDELSSQYDTPEFSQVLFELNLKTRVCIHVLGIIIEENNNIKNTLLQFVKN